eukprot:TRINITY_DN6746_c0_g1_i1.p1 TRINITY_DN6746_c0_g1~~TRINITY_DN6746_c0_g1_i1.p1  ORF type:complete len:377 (+),score=57.15 TRINITY_DN6746_c0_g1_i1:84-1214(+)
MATTTATVDSRMAASDSIRIGTTAAGNSDRRDVEVLHRNTAKVFRFDDMMSDYAVEEYTELHNDDKIVTVGKSESAREGRLTRLLARIKSRVLHNESALAQCAFVWFGAMATYAYANYGRNVGGNLAQATVVLLGCQIAPQMSAPLAFGAYLGTGSKELLPSVLWLAIMTLVGCLVWRIVCKYKIFVGFSGRLGISAFVTCHFVQLAVAMPLGVVSWRQYGHHQVLWDQTLTGARVTAYLVCPMLSALLARTLRDMGGALENPVTGATAAALLGFVALSVTGWDNADDLMDGVGIGSFVGMASTELLPTYPEFMSTGFFAGGFFILMHPFLTGWSGKQGTTAFLGFVVSVALRRLYKAFLDHRTARPRPEQLSDRH